MPAPRPRQISDIMPKLQNVAQTSQYLVKFQLFGENSAKFWQIWRHFGKKQQKVQQFLTKILRLESGAKECIV